MKWKYYESNNLQGTIAENFMERVEISFLLEYTVVSYIIVNIGRYSQSMLQVKVSQVRDVNCFLI